MSGQPQPSSPNRPFPVRECNALDEMVTVNVAAGGDDSGNVARTSCRIERQGPAFASLGMSPDASRTKFCAEPAARVFD